MIRDRDHARELIAKAGITTDNVTDQQLKSLHKSVSTRMLASGNYRGSYKMMRLRDKRFMECQTEQWQRREAISFNNDGFIGIAGWADNSNVRPILDGIADWLEQNYIRDKLAENGIDIDELECE